VLVLSLGGSVFGLTLTQSEREWIRENPVIRVGAETDWPPFDFAVAGRATGYSNEYVEMLTKKVGLKVDYVVGPTFNELLGMAKKREVDMMPALWLNEERKTFLTFLTPYYTTRHGIFLHRSFKDISKVDEIAGLRLIGVAGYNSTKLLHQNFPKARIREVDSPLDALLALNGNEADAYVGSIGVSGYFIQENRLENIRVMTGLKGSAFENNEALHVAVRNDWPLLAGILSKAKKELDPDELNLLRERWIKAPAEEKVPWALLLSWTIGILVVFSAVITWVTSWNRRLAKEIEERKTAEKEIEKHRANLLEIIEAGKDSIWSIDNMYRLTISNKAFHENLKASFGRSISIGEDLNEVARKTLPDLSIAEKWKSWYDRVLSGERFVVQERYHEIHYELRFMPISSHGEIVGGTCTMLNITAHKTLEESLRESKEAAEEASRTKSMFLANMSHEIRTPMNGILGLASLLSDTEMKPEQREHLDQLQKSSESLLGLLDDILHLAKVDAGRIELEKVPFDLRSLVNETVQLIGKTERARGLELPINIDPSFPAVVLGDSYRIRQCLINLLGNAVKFTEEGSVSIQVAQSENGRVKFSVTDTGVGIPEDRQKSIFEAFVQADISTTRKFGGSGLGLAITSQLISMMEGSLELDSVQGVGSTFSFVIPLPATSERLPEKVVDQDVDAQREWPNAKVLLAEDSKTNVIVAKGFLERFKLNVKVASNGVEAIDYLREEDFDLVLMDCHMPEMDGFEATQRIRDGEGGIRDKSIPIIALTADVMEEVVERCLSVGMNAYLSKPLDQDQLRDSLVRVLG